MDLKDLRLRVTVQGSPAVIRACKVLPRMNSTNKLLQSPKHYLR